MYSVVKMWLDIYLQRNDIHNSSYPWMIASTLNTDALCHLEEIIYIYHSFSFQANFMNIEDMMPFRRNLNKSFSLSHLNADAMVPLHFYTPVWKTGRIMPWQCPSVRLSVRPSVRPRFPDFSSTCFEISIWNLVYAFSRWHDISSLSCITIGSIWPSLQPKVGQTYFLQSWPHKSR